MNAASLKAKRHDLWALNFYDLFVARLFVNEKHFCWKQTAWNLYVPNLLLKTKRVGQTVPFESDKIHLGDRA